MQAPGGQDWRLLKEGVMACDHSQQRPPLPIGLSGNANNARGY
jgi:hypothetical protein